MSTELKLTGVTVSSWGLFGVSLTQINELLTAIALILTIIATTITVCVWIYKLVLWIKKRAQILNN